ncbi:hypothetical protein D3C75_608400 [compost metagenome]
MFQPKVTDLFRRGADKNKAVFGARLGKFSPFGQKTVAREYRLCATLFGCRDDFPDIEVTVRCFFATQRDGDVGVHHMLCIGIGFGVHRHAGDTHFLECFNGANSNFTAVCYQY